jgi:SEC-C motif-containing protein
MRARYSAYVVGEIDFLGNTLDSEGRNDFDADSTREWSSSTNWKELKILASEQGGKDDAIGMVEFVARYEMDGQLLEHHERATFQRNENQAWEFVDGQVVGQEPYRRESPKIGRNAPCPCGSGKKYKKCCDKK